MVWFCDSVQVCEMSSCWTELKSVEFRCFQPPIKIDNHTFVLVPSKTMYDRRTKGIYAYNTKQNDWTKFMNYPKNITLDSHSALLDDQKNSIYVYKWRELLEFDINSQNVSMITDEECFERYPGFVLYNDKFYLFSKHKYGIYDRKTKLFLVKEIPHKSLIYAKSVTLLRSKSKILMFGYHINKIYMYCLKTGEWTNKTVDNIRRYPMSTLLTPDEKYLITVRKSSIRIYDIDSNIMKLSKIQSPSFNESRAIIMDNTDTSNLLAFGFVRNVFGDKESLLPLDVLNMIARWLSIEYLHLIESVVLGKHWKIALHELLQTV